MAVERSEVRRIEKSSNAVPHIKSGGIWAFSVFHGFVRTQKLVIIYNFYNPAGHNFNQIKKDMKTVVILNNFSAGVKKM